MFHLAHSSKISWSHDMGFVYRFAIYIYIYILPWLQSNLLHHFGQQYNCISHLGSTPYRTITVRDIMSDLPPIRNGCKTEETAYSDATETHFQRLVCPVSSFQLTLISVTSLTV